MNNDGTAAYDIFCHLEKSAELLNVAKDMVSKYKYFGKGDEVIASTKPLLEEAKRLIALAEKQRKRYE